MKSLLIVVLAVALAAAQNQEDVQILRYENNNSGLGAYNFIYELTDGSRHEEQGQLKNQGTKNDGIAVQGEYSWVGPDDAATYTVTYIADKNGFRPQVQRGPSGLLPRAVVASLLGLKTF